MLIWLIHQPWIIINENDEYARNKFLFDKHINMGSMNFFFDYNKQFYFYNVSFFNNIFLCLECIVPKDCNSFINGQLITSATWITIATWTWEKPRAQEQLV